MKQISIQITKETARQIAWLARHWGYPARRHNTAIIERAINTVYMFEIGCDEYRTALEIMQQSDKSMEDLFREQSTKSD